MAACACKNLDIAFVIRQGVYASAIIWRVSRAALSVLHLLKSAARVCVYSVNFTGYLGVQLEWLNLCVFKCVYFADYLRVHSSGWSTTTEASIGLTVLPPVLGLLWKILYIFDQYHASTIAEGLVSVFNWYLRAGSIQCRCHLTATGLYHHAGSTMCVPVTSCGMVPVLVVALQPLECVLVVFTYQYLIRPLPVNRLVLVHLVMY